MMLPNEGEDNKKKNKKIYSVCLQTLHLIF